ncbi:restriction endonuclease subunit S, partial [Casaltella massiliensis]|nr:restriction endonuclease subunit S [Casaltella massiliensis]
KVYFKNLFYIIQSSYFRVQVENYWSFGTQPNIGMGTLENLYIPLSKNKEEQYCICEYLDRKVIFIDSLINKIKLQIEK